MKSGEHLIHYGSSNRNVREVIFIANSFWEEEDDYFKLEPLTEELVEKAEKDLKIKLPPSYINILKEQNGGFIT